MFFAKSLRAKTVLWALIPTAFVLALVAVIALYAYDRVTRDVVVQRDTELARVSAARLAEGMRRYSGILEAAAAAEGIGAMDPARVSAALEGPRASLAVFDAGVVVYDANAVAHWSEPYAAERDGTHFPLPADFARVRATLRPTFSDAFRDTASGDDVVLVTVPILEGGAFQGVLSGMFTLRYSLVGATFAQVLELKAGQTGFAYLVDGNGRVLYHQDGSLVGESLDERPPVVRAIRGETGAIVARDSSGPDVVSGFAPVPGTRWGLITQERWRNVVRPIRSYIWLLLGLLGAGGVLSAGVIFFTIGRILQPVRDLTVGARRIAGGDFEQLIAADTGDEVQALAEQFNTMATSLKQSYEGLELRVAERTEELRASEESYRRIFEHSNDAIFAFDLPNDRIVDMNPKACEMLGYSREELLSLRVSDVHPDEMPALRAFTRSVQEQGHGWTSELTCRTKSGEKLPAEISASAVEADGYNLVIAMVRDLTERRQAEQALQQQTRGLAVVDERNRMAREIHDTLAQGLIGIIWQLNAAERTLQTDPEGGMRALDRARGLASESLQEARRSVWELRAGPLEGRTLSAAVRQEAERTFAETETKIAVSVSEGERVLPSGVEVAVFRIFQEALTNARKHAAASEVEVQLAFGDSELRLTVRDHGVGFVPEAQASIGTEEHFGLISMRERARLLGGRVTVASEPGTGTTVELTLPVP